MMRQIGPWTIDENDVVTANNTYVGQLRDFDKKSGNLVALAPQMYKDLSETLKYLLVADDKQLIQLRHKITNTLRMINDE